MWRSYANAWVARIPMVKVDLVARKVAAFAART